jgi:VanZ family protein
MKKHYKIPFTLGVIIWIGLILSFSSEPGDVSKEKSKMVEGAIRPAVELIQGKLGVEIVPSNRVHFYVRRSAHLFLYTVLGIGLVLVFRKFELKGRNPYYLALITGTLVGGIDETLQSFVPGRSARVMDVLLDSSGVLLGLFVVKVLLKNKEICKE